MDNFKQQLLATLEDLCKSTGTKVSTTQVIKQNDVILSAICLSPENSNIGSNYYVEDLFRQYQSGSTIMEIATDILRHNRNDSIFTDNALIAPFISRLSSYDFIKSHLMVRLLNLSSNNQYLLDKVYQPYLDTEDSHELAICLYIQVPELKDGNGMITVTHHLRSHWDVTDDVLFKDALLNTEATSGCRIRSIYEVLTSLTDAADILETLNNVNTEPAMYVMTNNNSFNGAATILYPNELKSFADDKECDFYVLPSSTHEVILVPDTGTIDAASIKDMIVQVNQTIVSPSEVLSNQLFYYSRTDNRISIYATS